MQQKLCSYTAKFGLNLKKKKSGNFLWIVLKLFHWLKNTINFLFFSSVVSLYFEKILCVFRLNSSRILPKFLVFNIFFFFGGGGAASYAYVCASWCEPYIIIKCINIQMFFEGWGLNVVVGIMEWFTVHNSAVYTCIKKPESFSHSGFFVESC